MLLLRFKNLITVFDDIWLPTRRQRGLHVYFIRTQEIRGS